MLFTKNIVLRSRGKPEYYPRSRHYVCKEYPFPCHKIQPDEKEMEELLEWLEKEYDNGLMLLQLLPPFGCIFLDLGSSRK